MMDITEYICVGLDMIGRIKYYLVEVNRTEYNGKLGGTELNIYNCI